MPRSSYLYVLHRNVDGWETAPRRYSSKEFALLSFGAEVGESLKFIEDGGRSGSQTLKRFANRAEQPGELLETFLATRVLVREG